MFLHHLCIGYSAICYLLQKMKHVACFFFGVSETIFEEKSFSQFFLMQF